MLENNGCISRTAKRIEIQMPFLGEYPMPWNRGQLSFEKRTL
jgi:hypothetical protein